MTNCCIINASFTNSELIKKYEKAGYKIRVSQKLTADIILSGSPSIAFIVINLKSYILPEIMKRIFQQSKQFQYSVIIMQCKTDGDMKEIIEIQRKIFLCSSYIYLSMSNDHTFQIMTQIKSIITNDIGSKKDELIKSITETSTTRVSASNVLKVIPDVKSSEADLLVDSLGSLYNVIERMGEGLHNLSPISEIASYSIKRFFEESDIDNVEFKEDMINNA